MRSGEGKRVSAFVHVSGNIETVYASHLNKDARKDMNEDVLLN